MITFSELSTRRPTPSRVAPDLPRTDLLEPTLTTVLPEIVPEIRTILAVSSLRASVRSSRVLTVTVEPLEPPVVLEIDYKCQVQVNRQCTHLPS